MMEPVISGLLFGLVLATLIGPVFFSLVQTSIDKGFVTALFLALGVLLSDSLYIALSYFGTHRFFESENFKYWVGLVGGILLITFGFSAFFKKPKAQQTVIFQNHSPNRAIIKGFLLNTMNPFVFFFWLGAVGLIAAKENYSEGNILTFFTVTLITVFSTDLLKAFIADRLKKFLTPNLLAWLNRISGIALMIFGIRMLLKVI